MCRKFDAEPSFFTVTDCSVVATVQLVLPMEEKGIVNNQTTRGAAVKQYLSTEVKESKK